jgi:hypothetical protein
MKKNYFLLSFIFVATILNAQTDTLLFQGFETIDFATMLKEPTGKDVAWINWDKDGKESASAAIPSFWYKAPEIYQAQVTKPPVFNQTAHSLSWLKGELLGSKNVLISPPITITDDKSTLSWQSCPLQGPAFMDGYKVLISVTSNDLTKVKPDTVFVAAEVTSYKDPSTLVLKDYTFSKGYIHANGYTKAQYWDTTGLVAYHRGRLEPHTVSLAKYKGKKIYVHFYHDSSDDYIFELDNILVRANQPVSNKDAFANQVHLVTYPNPATTAINVLYRIENQSKININLTNIEGKVVSNLFDGEGSGEMNHTFDVNALATGTYFIQVKIGDKIATEKFIKE